MHTAVSAKQITPPPPPPPPPKETQHTQAHDGAPLPTHIAAEPVIHRWGAGAGDGAHHGIARRAVSVAGGRLCACAGACVRERVCVRADDESGACSGGCACMVLRMHGAGLAWCRARMALAHVHARWAHAPMQGGHAACMHAHNEPKCMHRGQAACGPTLVASYLQTASAAQASAVAYWLHRTSLADDCITSK